MPHSANQGAVLYVMHAHASARRLLRLLVSLACRTSQRHWLAALASVSGLRHSLALFVPVNCLHHSPATSTILPTPPA
ncbi:protein of unknown function [Pararobbsia alpina]